MILKICGITNQEDASRAVAGGATASVSISTGAARATWRRSAPPGFKRRPACGASACSSTKRANASRRSPAIAALDVAQLHGGETPADYPASLAVWKAVRVGEVLDLSQWRDCPAEALLLDGPASGVASTGGWRRRLPSPSFSPEAWMPRTSPKPWRWPKLGVDACSRIESAPGKKDHRKMNEFLQAAKAALDA